MLLPFKPPLPRNALCQERLKLAKWLCKGRFLDVHEFISILSPLEIGCSPSFEQSSVTFTQGCHLSGMVEIGQVWPFVCKNLNSLHPWTLCAKFG